MNQVPTDTSRQFLPQQLAAATAVALLAAAAIAVWTRERVSVHRPAVTSASSPRAAQERCAECHFEICESFHTAPHARTLHRATHPDVAETFAAKSFHRADSNVDYRYELRDGRLTLSTPAYARDLPIDWIFGSGEHARTPLIIWTDNEGSSTAIEHSVSWYPPGDLGVTLGMEQLDDATSYYALGRHWGPAETINCFGCHSTYVPTAGERIDFDRIEPGVGCARCHWDTAAHVREMDSDLDATIERFSELTPAQSVDRCGECHRRASEMGGPITPDNRTIVRFAPVGLVQSPCFLKQDEVRLDSGTPARLDCTTCHDPHRHSSRDPQAHIAVCLNCHDAERGRAADCSAAARDDNCLTCHMPPVAMNEHLHFTDHWIRIRREAPEGTAAD